MGLFGFGNKKKKNAELKKQILKELGSVNSSSIEMNKKINQLEDVVSEHSINGDKEETKVLEDLLGQVSHIKSMINTNKDAAARTSITRALDLVEKWTSTSVSKNYKEEENNQFDLDSTKDELTKALARQEELRKYLLAHPEQQRFYKSEWDALNFKIKTLNQDLQTYEQEQKNVIIAQTLHEQTKTQQKILQRTKENHATNEEIQANMAALQESKKNQAEWNEQANSAEQLLFSDSSSSFELEGLSGQSSNGFILEGLEAPGSAQSSGMMMGGTQQVQESANIQQALKKVEENLAKLEDANEDIKDKLAEKDKEYNRVVAKARELLIARKGMSPAEYNTVDYKINELKMNVVSLNKIKMTYQNVLQQNNLKIALLKQLETEKDLDMVNKYGVNIDMVSVQEMALYLSAKGDEKNAQLTELDTFTGGVLKTETESLTNTGEVDLSSAKGDPNAWEDFEKLVGVPQN